jgi:hypothetical protein
MARISIVSARIYQPDTNMDLPVLPNPVAPKPGDLRTHINLGPLLRPGFGSPLKRICRPAELRAGHFFQDSICKSADSR